MTFSIDEVELPIFPQKIVRKLTRKPSINNTQFGFPSMTDTGPDTFQLQVSGYIWDEVKAQELWELTKDASGEALVIAVTEDKYDWINGLYAVTKTNISRKKSLSTLDAVSLYSVDVWKYDITFVQYAETGAFEPGDTGGIDLDEPGIGFGDFEDIIGPWLFDAWNMYANLFE